jgi:exonuclease III
MTTFDAETLNLVHQEVALELECAWIQFELCDQLGLQAEVLMDQLFAEASVKLNDGYCLVIRPSRPGFNGVSTWLKWQEMTHPSSGEVMTLSQVRCVVELQFAESKSNEIQRIISFGIEALNMEQLIKKSLRKISHLCELRLVALPQTKLNKAIN